MIQHVTGKIVNGELQLEEAIQFPDESHVNVVIRSNSDATPQRRQSLENFLEFMQSHPVNESRPFRREDLYDRG